MTTGAVLSGIGMHQVQPVSIQITVRAYLFPLILGGGGWNSPTKSMEMKSMGVPGTAKVPLLYFGEAILCCLHFLTYFVTSGSETISSVVTSS